MPQGEHAKQKLEIAHSHFFVLRTPLLPMEELLAWSTGLSAAQAAQPETGHELLDKTWMKDVQLLRNRLRAVIDRPEILHALYVASPSLQTGIAHWKKDPESKKGLQAERALVRYFTRMVTRSTPFGLFSGCSVGRLQEGEGSALLLKPQPQYRLCCRLDFDYLFALTAALRRDLEMELRYWPNSSLHKIGDAWHYTESRLVEEKRTHHLVKVESDPYLEAVLKRAERGATIPELTEAVLKQPGDANPSEQEARDYVQQIVRENDLLVPALTPLLTGKSPLDDIIEQLETLPSGANFAPSLRSIRDRIFSVEHKSINSAPEDYEAIAAEVEKLPAKFDRARLLQVDMMKPVEDAVLGRAVIDELVKAVRIMCYFGKAQELEEIANFRTAFLARYEHALIPLAEALDPEAGVGFGKSAGTDGSPLLRGLGLRELEEARWAGDQLDAQNMLLQKAFECARTGKAELELNISREQLEGVDTRGLADAFCMVGTLAAASPEDMNRGDFEIYIQNGGGPSGARPLGRFCHADPELRAYVQNHLRQEEAHDANAIFAEVVYLPEGRLGNVLCRPDLRDYEIPYLGRSGAAPEHQLPVSDLMVGIEGGSIVLYSRRLGRRVVPRLTTAHGFMDPRFSPVYRFLCYLQQQHAVGLPGFYWRSLEALDFLPRARAGRLIFSLARWKLSQEEVAAVGKPERSGRFLAVQELRRRRALPRWVVLHEGDNLLPVDLDNALSVDAFVHVLKRSEQAILAEMYPAPDKLCVSGPEGHFYHELNVPFVRVPQRQPQDQVRPVEKSGLALATAGVGRETRILPPGSEWLYLKLYGGTGILDDILTTAVLPLARAVYASGAAVRWFFIRYADPHEHLRVRFQGEPGRLHQEVLSLAFQALNPLLASGKLWKVELDTYQREIERYGGPEGMLIAEDIFFADSEAVLDILRELGGDEGLDIRWRIGLVGIDRMLSDFGLEEKARQTLMEQSREMLQREFRIEATVKQQLSEKFRAERHKLEALLAEGPGLRWSFAEQALENRSARMAEAVQKLRTLQSQGKLTVNLPDLAQSFVHMHVNRLIRSAQQAHELVLYDFLFQLYDSRIARRAREQSGVAVR